MKLEFITTEWSDIIAGLQAGKFDVIVNQVGITDARKQTLDFSPAYTYSNAQLIQRKDDTREFSRSRTSRARSSALRSARIIWTWRRPFRAST